MPMGARSFPASISTFDEDAEAGEGQDARHGERTGKTESQSAVEADVGSDDQGSKQRGEHGYDRRDGASTPDRLQKAGDVEFVQPDQEEEQEDAPAQQHPDLAGGIDDSRDRPQQESRRRVGNDRVQPEPAEDSLEQLAEDDEQAGGKKSFLDQVGAAESIPRADPTRKSTSSLIVEPGAKLGPRRAPLQLFARRRQSGGRFAGGRLGRSSMRLASA